MELEVVEVEGEVAIRCAADEPTDFVNECWAAVTGQPHDFVFSLVHLESEIRCKGRVSHPQGIWESNFTQQGDAGSTLGTPRAEADRRRGPLADAIASQDRSTLR